MGAEKKKTIDVRKKKVSKITKPLNPDNAMLVAFRADAELSMLLRNEPNKSETIQLALREYFAHNVSVTCARCKGTGKMRKKNKTIKN